MAIQNQVVWVSDSSGGISLTPATSTSGVVTYTGSDTFWSVVVSTGTAYPPAVGQGTLSAPVMDLSIIATSTGAAGSSGHTLSITFGADGFGPTSGGFMALMSGHLVSGTANPVVFSTDYATTPTSLAGPPASPPAGTQLTTSGSLAGPTYSSLVDSGIVTLGSPYILEEVVTIGAATAGSYSLDGSLTTVPDGGTTAMLLGAALSVLGLIRRKLA